MRYALAVPCHVDGWERPWMTVCQRKGFRDRMSSRSIAAAEWMAPNSFHTEESTSWDGLRLYTINC